MFRVKSIKFDFRPVYKSFEDDLFENEEEE